MEYNTLKMTADKNTGSFVRDLQGESGVGFADGTHVHKDWWKTTMSYDEGLELMQRSIEDRQDMLVKASDIRPTVDNGRFVFEVNGLCYSPTDWALQQFSTRSGVPSSTVLGKLHNDTKGVVRDEQDAVAMKYLAANSLRRVDPDKEFLLRTYKSDSTLRSFVTDKYAPIDNRWYIEQLQKNLPNGRLSHWRGDEDTIFGNVLLPDTVMDYGQDDDSDYGGMVSISNCEIGKRRIGQQPSLFRSICLNGCIWGQVAGKEIKKRHIGEIDLNELALKLRENIEAQLPLIPLGMRKLMETRGRVIGTARLDQVVAAAAKDFKLDKRQASATLQAWNKFESEHRSQFGLVNAITRAGQTLGNDQWNRFDKIGGNLVDFSDNRWDNLIKRSNTITDKDMKSIYAGELAV